MIITAKMVKELRMLTGAGIMECKKALVSSSGSIRTAVKKIKESGLFVINDRSNSTVKDGMVVTVYSKSLKKTVMIEVNSETDFVARSKDFRNFVYHLSYCILKNNTIVVKDILQLILHNGKTVGETLNSLILKVGEKVLLRRAVSIEGNGLTCYNHGNRIGVLLKMEGGNASLAKDLAMHIAALNPLSVSKDRVPLSILEKESNIFSKQVPREGKSDAIMKKILLGKISKFLDDKSLIAQKFVKIPEYKVGDLLVKNTSRVIAFSRFFGENLDV
jgi:elongation factor Ts